jgi:hypothetical protein
MRCSTSARRAHAGGEFAFAKRVESEIRATAHLLNREPCDDG